MSAVDSVNRPREVCKRMTEECGRWPGRAGDVFQNGFAALKADDEVLEVAARELL